MNKDYNLRLDLQFRCNNPVMKFDKFDNDTSDFFIQINSGGKLFDIENAIVVLAAIKPNGKVECQFVDVDNGLVYANLKPSMKDEIGVYTAKAMLILGEERIVTDDISYEVTEDNTFSMLNDTVENNENLTVLTDMLSRLSNIETNEKTRIANEVDRLELQNELEELIKEVEKSEVDRKEHEVNREKLYLEMEDVLEKAKLINSNSTSINKASSELITSMNLLNENVSNAYNDVVNVTKEVKIIENEISENEAERQKFYGNSKITMQQVENSEDTRRLNENTRISNEKAREVKVSNYESRYEKLINDISNLKNSFEEFNSQANSNEESRVQAEQQREERYTTFETDYNTIKNNINSKLQEINQTKNTLINEVSKAKTNLTNTISNEITSQTKKVDNKITEIDNVKNQMVSNVTNATNEANRLIGVAEGVIEEVDNVKSSMINDVNSKVNEVNQVKTNLTNTVDNKITDIENRFNALTAQQQQDAEVITARDGEVSLCARLERDLKKGKETYIDLEGSCISTDSNEGYLKNIEILGNTIQDTTNLQDIKSVGDKVEGQELYKITIVSCGKNLNNSIIELGGLTTSLGLPTDNNVQFRSKDFIRVIGNKSVYATINEPNLVISGFYSYDKNENFISAVTQGKELPENCKYLKIFGRHKVSGTDISSIISDNIKVQLEYGTQGTSYEPYQEDRLTILSPVQLEKVGDIQDRIIEKDGVWGVYKNIVVDILDDTFRYSMYTSKSNVDILIIDKKAYHAQVYYNDIRKNILLQGYKSGMLYNQDINDVSFIGYIYQNQVNNGVIFAKNTTLENAKSQVLGKKIYLQYAEPKFIPLPNDQQIKLKSFANKTNICFLTEIEGSIKAKVPNSLGATINTNIEQINKINKEIASIKKLEETKATTVETESNFATVESTNNGYFEDIKLEGKTLVNCLKFSEDWFPTETTLQTDSITAIGLSSYAKKMDFSLLKDNTTYTVIPFVDYRVTKKGTLYLQLNTEIDGTLSSLFRVYEDMFNKPTLITTTELTDKNRKSLFIGGANCSYNFKSVKILILEGDYTQNSLEYFEGLMSVGDNVDEISIKSTDNGNLIDLSNITEGVYISNTGNLATNVTSFCCDSYIKVYPNVLYQFVCANGSPQICRVSCYEEDKTYISTTEYGINTPIYFNRDVKFIKLSFFNRLSIKDKLYFGTNNHYTNKLISLDKKNILYYNEETQTWEKPILREWDSIEKHSNGKYYYHKRSGEDVLNGSKTWTLLKSNTSNNTIGFYTNLVGGASNLDIISDKLTTKRYESGSLDFETEQIMSGNSFSGQKGRIGIILLRSKLTTQDVEGFKQYLQANPIKVVYQLAEEKVYECTNIDLITYQNETNYIVESGAITPKTTLKVHNNISNIVNLLQKKVSILENNMADYIITQNRLLLTSRYNSDTLGFNVNAATLSVEDSLPQYDNDLYNLILANIIVGKDNYNRNYMESLINFYWMTFIISDEMYFTLSNIIEEQHNTEELEEPPINN